MLPQRFRATLTLLVLLACALRADAQPPAADLRVRVMDALGDPIAGASAVVDADDRGRGKAVITGADGVAIVPVPELALPLVLRVSAPGFGEHVEALQPGSAAFDVTLEPAARTEQVTVTAGRRAVRGADLPADATVLSRRDLEVAAAGTIDDVLRLTPGFSLFRRSPSRTANPTTQGVTLRGLSASGASRTLVLADGVPLNDPFGGWVSWDRVPQVAIDRVEVVRGGASDLYGADAAGGVIQVLSVEPSSPVMRALVEGGTQESGRVSALAGTRRGPWTGMLAGEFNTTEGAIPIAPEIRGPIDTPAGVESSVLSATVGGAITRLWRASLRGHVYDEDRTNGTPLQDNDTNQRQASFDIAGAGPWGDLRLRAFALGQGYDQAFSAVNATRTAETLSSRQRVASTMGGGSAEFVRALGRVVLLAGGDFRRVDGDMIERRPVGAPTVADGRQDMLGGFAQATWAAWSRVVVVGGVRADSIDVETTPGGQRDIDAFSPKGSVAWTLGSAFTLRGSAYKAFRAPTLNERLRSFRAGNTLTQNNPALDRERATGGDVSLAWEPRRVSLRATLFAARLEDAITNVTVTTTPTLITRERRNAGTIGARGLEVEGRVQLLPSLSVAGTLAWTRSRFDESDEPGLEGNRVPQVPTAQGGFDVRWQPLAASMIVTQMRWTGTQYDDDRNLFELGRSFVTDLMGEHRFAEALRAFVAIENLFDADYDTGRTPLRTVGPPRRIRGGVRVAF
ncbi:TonB-dependent receptor [Luteitalea sp. TBR-22]|uniref:TonB-dependent receptor n=1 Tax=Luteitalea sp. TBR-22 TaxID=2802971 RepID=UPI001EF4542D|nr:TonB-dependent receptor [Luteitalea sp. TBR-22]